MAKMSYCNRNKQFDTHKSTYPLSTPENAHNNTRGKKIDSIPENIFLVRIGSVTTASHNTIHCYEEGAAGVIKMCGETSRVGPTSYGCYDHKGIADMPELKC